MKIKLTATKILKTEPTIFEGIFRSLALTSIHFYRKVTQIQNFFQSKKNHQLYHFPAKSPNISTPLEWQLFNKHDLNFTKLYEKSLPQSQSIENHSEKDGRKKFCG